MRPRSRSRAIGLPLGWGASLPLAACLSGSERQQARRGIEADPMTAGTTVSLDQAARMIADCGCPGLPDEGLAAPVNVVRAWAEGDHFGYNFADQFTISYKSTAQTPEEFAEEVRRYNEDPDETGAIGELVSLRRTTAWWPH